MLRHNMERRKKMTLMLVVIAVSGLALSACGGVSVGSGVSTGSGPGTPPASASVSVDTFAVQGTNGVTAVSKSGATPGTAIIDGNQDSGQFGVSWMTTTGSSTAERITVSLSTTANGTAGGDQIILQRNCNTPGSTDCAGTNASFGCQFQRSNMRVLCPVASTSPQDVYEVSQFFANNSGLPGSYFMVMQACVTDVGGKAICDSRSLPAMIR